MALGSSLMGGRRSWVSGCSGLRGESAKDWEDMLEDLWPRGVSRVRIFIPDDLPGLEEAIGKIFPEADWQLCGLHAVRDAPTRRGRMIGEALAQDLKAVYQTETEREEKEALRNLRERWGTVYPWVVVHQEPRAYALLAFLRHSKPIRRYLYTPNLRNPGQ